MRPSIDIFRIVSPASSAANEAKRRKISGVIPLSDALVDDSDNSSNSSYYEENAAQSDVSPSASPTKHLKDKTEYLAYFVKEKNGEYVEVYGITQSVAYLRLPVHKLEESK